jgi:CRP-like cAMP-binding protein
MEQEHLESIAHTILFNGIDIKDIPHVLACLEHKITRFEKNDYIAKLGDTFTGVFIILDGEAAVVRESYNGNRVAVNVFRVGDIFGEAVAFCGAGIWPGTIQALTDCTLMVVHPEKILNMCNRSCTFHKVILANMIRVIAKKACDLNRKVEYLMLKSINGKLSKYLLEQSAMSGKLTFRLPLNREKLADFLNISRPSMSRELGLMRDRGIIDFHGDLIRIKNEEKLRALLED